MIGDIKRCPSREPYMDSYIVASPVQATDIYKDKEKKHMWQRGPVLRQTVIQTRDVILDKETRFLTK